MSTLSLLCLHQLTVSAKALCYELSVCCFRLSVCSFVQTDLVTMISHEWCEQSRRNLVEYTLEHADKLIEFWRSKVKVTADRRGQIL